MRFPLISHKIFPALHCLLLMVQIRILGAVRGHHDDDGARERGDVPGWVMITLMSAVLVAALLALAGPALEGMFNDAINRVNP